MKPAARSSADRLVRLSNGVAALVQLQDGIIQALHAHLDFGHTQIAQPGQLAGVHMIRACLDHQAYIAVDARLVRAVCFCQVCSIRPRSAHRNSAG